MRDDRTRRLCALLAELLSYPRPGLEATAREASLAAPDPGAAAGLARFAAAVQRTPPEALEERYTATFELAPACAPYLFAHLVGDDGARRGALLARLAELEAADGFRPREDLPDHVAEVLAYAAVGRDGPERDALIADGLVPALAAMAAALEGAENPYRDVLVAARALVAASPPGAARTEVRP